MDRAQTPWTLNGEAAMLKLGNMLWRIGDILDLDAQIAWTREAGFDGVGFHASAGLAGEWTGVDPAACEERERQRLRTELASFAYREIHAPLAIELKSASLDTDIASLDPALGLAADLGAQVVTVHAQLPQEPDAAGELAWTRAMRQLSNRAAECPLRVALEITHGFALVRSWGLPNVGVCLDVGHMALAPNRQALARAGGFAALIHEIGGALHHLHLHDVASEVDHLEIGSGAIPFGEIVAALQEIGYAHGATLEMNPDRVTPEGIARSLARLRTLQSTRPAV